MFFYAGNALEPHVGVSHKDLFLGLQVTAFQDTVDIVLSSTAVLLSVCLSVCLCGVPDSFRHIVMSLVQDAHRRGSRSDPVTKIRFRRNVFPGSKYWCRGGSHRLVCLASHLREHKFRLFLRGTA